MGVLGTVGGVDNSGYSIPKPVRGVLGVLGVSKVVLVMAGRVRGVLGVPKVVLVMTGRVRGSLVGSEVPKTVLPSENG